MNLNLWVTVSLGRFSFRCCLMEFYHRNVYSVSSSVGQPSINLCYMFIIVTILGILLVYRYQSKYIIFSIYISILIMCYDLLFRINTEKSLLFRKRSLISWLLNAVFSNCHRFQYRSGFSTFTSDTSIVFIHKRKITVHFRFNKFFDFRQLLSVSQFNENSLSLIYEREIEKK